MTSASGPDGRLSYITVALEEPLYTDYLSTAGDWMADFVIDLETDGARQICGYIEN